MTDRELLELAAKAAGVELVDDEHGETWRVYHTDPNNGLKRYTRWNPIYDDGDALRLAVKLTLPIEHFSVTSTGKDRVSAAIGMTPELYGNDPYAATRRAIVRAAAEIGKEKQNA